MLHRPVFPLQTGTFSLEELKDSNFQFRWENAKQTKIEKIPNIESVPLVMVILHFTRSFSQGIVTDAWASLL